MVMPQTDTFSRKIAITKTQISLKNYKKEQAYKPIQSQLEHEKKNLFFQRKAFTTLAEL
jgi:hypothetical protein